MDHRQINDEVKSVTSAYENESPNDQIAGSRVANDSKFPGTRNDFTAPGASLSGYIPTLDGWRAVAVLAVISFHDKVHGHGLISTLFIHKISYHGVSLFYAISGMLICSRLLQEEQRFGKINLKGFYLRRLFRIQPAALFYLVVIGMMALHKVVPLSLGAFFSALFLFRNYYPFSGGISDLTMLTNHFWSLSLEEHFYLLFPGFLILCKYRRVSVLAGITLALLIWNAIVAATPALTIGPVPMWRTDMNMNALLIPALTAIAIKNPRTLKLAVQIIRPWSWVFIAGFFAVIATRQWLIVSVLSAILIYPTLLLGTILNPKSAFSRFLELAPLRFIGRISFSIYLWQQLFFTSDLSGPAPMGVFAIFPLDYLTVFLLGYLSYRFIERPMIKLGHRLAPPATPGHADIETNDESLSQELKAWIMARPDEVELQSFETRVGAASPRA